MLVVAIEHIACGDLIVPIPRGPLGRRQSRQLAGARSLQACIRLRRSVARADQYRARNVEVALKRRKCSARARISTCGYLALVHEYRTLDAWYYHRFPPVLVLSTTASPAHTMRSCSFCLAECEEAPTLRKGGTFG